MLFVDPRQGSCELVKPLRAAGLNIDDTVQLDCDIHFTGRGERGAPVSIGIEHKKVSDLISSLNSARLQGLQLPRMLDTYDRNWLIVEGDWQHDEHGRVTMFKSKGRRRPVHGAPPAVELEKRLLTLEIRGGFRIRHCATRRDTVRFVVALYRTWTDKDLDEHKSHLAMHEGPDFDRKLRIPMSDFRQAIARLDGIGYVTSQYIEQKCWDTKLNRGSWDRLMRLTIDNIAEIQTRDEKGNARRIGQKRAERIVEALR